MLDTVLEGGGRHDTLEPVNDVAEAMELSSICGLGQAAALPLTSARRHFPEEFETRCRQAADRRAPRSTGGADAQ